MFDYVKFEHDCPYCDEPLSDFQSKDGDCILATLEPQDVSYFYALCDNPACRKFVEFEVIQPTDLQVRVINQHSKDENTN